MIKCWQKSVASWNIKSYVDKRNANSWNKFRRQWKQKRFTVALEEKFDRRQKHTHIEAQVKNQFDSMLFSIDRSTLLFVTSFTCFPCLSSFDKQFCVMLRKVLYGCLWKNLILFILFVIIFNFCVIISRCLILQTQTQTKDNANIQLKKSFEYIKAKFVFFPYQIFLEWM